MKNQQSQNRAAVLLAAACVTVLIIIKVSGFILLTSASMPGGVWLRQPIKDIRKGMVIEFCPQPHETLQKSVNGDCPGGVLPVLKSIAAVPGDTVVVNDLGVAVNGLVLKNSARISAALPGINLQTPGQYQVREGSVWLVSEYNPRSLDSRYYGAVDVNRITMMATPVWLFGDK